MTETSAPAKLQAGDAAPAFTLPDDTGQQVSLADFRGRKIILYVYPEAMTSGCTTQACDFRDSLEPLAAAGYAVVGLSSDSPEKLAEFRALEPPTFPLLPDADKSVQKAYGAYGDKQLHGKATVGVIRSSFVIDEEGKIDKAMYNVKATGHVTRLREDLAV